MTCIPEPLCSILPVLSIIIALAAEMIHALGRLHVSRMRACLFNDGSELVRILKHRTGLKMVVIEGLVSLVNLKQRLLQAFDPAHVVNVRI